MLTMLALALPAAVGQGGEDGAEGSSDVLRAAAHDGLPCFDQPRAACLQLLSSRQPPPQNLVQAPSAQPQAPSLSLARTSAVLLQHSDELRLVGRPEILLGDARNADIQSHADGRLRRRRRGRRWGGRRRLRWFGRGRRRLGGRRGRTWGWRRQWRRRAGAWGKGRRWVGAGRSGRRRRRLRRRRPGGWRRGGTGREGRWRGVGGAGRRGWRGGGWGWLGKVIQVEHAKDAADSCVVRGGTAQVGHGMEQQALALQSGGVRGSARASEGQQAAHAAGTARSSHAHCGCPPAETHSLPPVAAPTHLFEARAAAALLLLGPAVELAGGQLAELAAVHVRAGLQCAQHAGRLLVARLAQLRALGGCNTAMGRETSVERAIF